MLQQRRIGRRCEQQLGDAHRRGQAGVLNKAGIDKPVQPEESTVESGETPIVTWLFLLVITAFGRSMSARGTT